jgi:hypothetical protein
MRSALSPKQKKIDMNKNGKLDANDFAMLRKGAKSGGKDEMDEDNAFDYKKPRSMNKGERKASSTGGEIYQKDDNTVVHTAGRNYGGGNEPDPAKEKQNRRGPPKKSDSPRQERVTSKSRKQDRTAHGQEGFKKAKGIGEGDVNITDQGEYDQEGDMAKDDIKTIVRHAQALSKVLGDNDNLPEWVQSKLAKIEGMMISVDEYMQNQSGEDEEEAIAEEPRSKNQAVAARIARGVQKGTAKAKPGSASAEMAKMKPKELDKFAKGSTKGLPKKVSKKKEEDVEESTTSAGSVATSTAAPKGGGGMSFGKGIYDSMNFELEQMIAESMNINMSDSTEGDKSLSVTATDDDAMKLAMILKSAGLGGGGGDMHSHGDESCPTCGMTDCGCGDVQEAVDENAPDWPTNTETNSDALQYAGGLNKPKTDVAGDGQTTIPNTAVHTQDEDALRRMMEMAGIAQAELEPWKETMKEEEEDKDFFHNPNVPANKQLPATPKEVNVELDEELEEDFLESIQRMREIAGIQEAKKADKDYDGDGKIESGKEEHAGSVDKAIKKAQAEKKVDESIFALTNQWKAYKG